jgi:ring-1,2-phenylacetyl-CoA epoxidase subunit PaaE
MEVLQAIFAHFPAGLAMELALYGTVLSLGYFLVWKNFKTRFQNWRIQINQRADATQIKEELKNAVNTLLIWAIYDSILLYLTAQGQTKMYTDVSEYGLVAAIATFFIMLVVDDAWFYWTHRLMHHPSVYRYVHAEHHKSIDVTPYSALSFHFLESIILPLWVTPLAMLVPMYMPVMFLFQIWAVYNNLKGHIGYEFFPENTNTTWLRYFTTSTHHNMHHSKFNGNYGLHFRFWDRLLGTEFKEYEAVFSQVQDRKKEGNQANTTYFPLVISDIKEETADTYSLVFKQFPNVFANYLAGQHITIKINIGDKPYARTFSLSSAPDDDFLQVTIKKVGLVTNFIKDNYKIGDTVEALLPTGKFVVNINPTNRRHYCMIAAGSGITPIFSMIKTILKQEPLSKITLLYANKSQGTKVFTSELANFSIYNGSFSMLDFFDTQQKMERADLEKVLNQHPENTTFYLCGPKGFMENIQSELTYLGVNPSNVFTEAFATVAHKPKNDVVGKPISDVMLHFNKTHHLQIMDNETLLDAFIREDINVPYSCQSGVCGTCKCTLVKGKVAMNNPQALTEKEIADGFILSCQSVPTTPDIEIKV